MENPANTPGEPAAVDSPLPGKEPPPKASWVNLIVDFGPLLVFFAVYKFYAPPSDANIELGVMVAVINGTIAFMIATIIALAVSKWRLGHVSPMLWLSTVLIFGFGLLTVFFGDPFWIQIKPTVIYLLFAALLFGGLLRGKAVLRYLLQSAFEGLDDTGWLKLSRNWAVFFVFLAGLNEVLRHSLSFEGWLQAKLWVFTTLSIGFTFAQLPMVLRHGLSLDARDDVVTNPPHE